MNARNVYLLHALTVALLSKTVLCHAHFTVANLREILWMLFSQIQILRSNDVTDTETGDKVLVMSVSVSNSNALPASWI